MTPSPETGAEPTAPVAEISPVDAEAVEAAVQAALAAYEAATDLDELKAARLAHTGDRAPLTLANKAIGALPKERKAEAGKLMGAARGRLARPWPPAPRCSRRSRPRGSCARRRWT